MIFLKKTNWLTLFIVTIICVLTIGNTFVLAHLVDVVKAVEPATVETVPEVKSTEETIPEATETVPETIAETVPEEVIPLISDCPLDDATQQMIYQICVEYDVDYPLVMSVIFNESSFRPNANSGSSVGLMQINKVNHKWLSKELGLTDFFDPKQNVTAGVYMLRKLFDKYEDPAKVLMAYNMGEGGASKKWKQGIYTSGYAKAVLSKADKYAKEIQERMG